MSLRGAVATRQSNRREIAAFLRTASSARTIVEIGGGGLSFVLEIIDIPGVERIICADPDFSSLNYHEIIQHYDLDRNYEEKIDDKCILMKCNSERFFELVESHPFIDAFVALRVAHFFSPDEFRHFLISAGSRIIKGGYMVLSGFGVTDHDNPEKLSEFYEHSHPISSQEHYRRLDENQPEAHALMRDQNIQRDLLFFEERFIRTVTEQAGFRVVRGPERATRIVDGYIFQKL